MDAEHEFRQHKTHKDLLSIKIAIKVILDDYNLLNIANVNSYQREEMKTILDIFQALCMPLFDHAPHDIFCKKEKKSILTRIEKTRLTLATNKTNYNLYYNTQEYREAFVHGRVQKIMMTILSLIHQAANPQWPITHNGKESLIRLLKQIASFETVIHLYPAMTTLSSGFIESEFAKLYIRLQKLLTQ